MPAPLFSPKEIAEGRRLFAGEWRFVYAAGSVGSLPPQRGVEVAFAGRSNVGKSSLVNALTGRNGLARISHTPGRTQELNFFSVGDRWKLVDMPGYGYAAAAKTKVAAWTELIRAYLRGRANLGRVYVLVDARHGIKAPDEAVFDLLARGCRLRRILSALQPRSHHVDFDLEHHLAEPARFAGTHDPL